MPHLQIIFENKDYIVVNKQAGLISEKSPYEDETVENQVLNHLSKSRKNPYLGIIHRLDRVTSGVLMMAKKKSILVKYNELFSQRKVQKIYLAIVKNKPPEDSGILRNFLVKNQKEKRAEIIENSTKNSLNCSLSYRLLDQNEKGYLLEIKPKTGRFHQIRAQLSHILSPIIGDEKYGSEQTYQPLSICLHAWKLQVPIRGSSDFETFVAPPPDNVFWKNLQID